MVRLRVYVWTSLNVFMLKRVSANICPQAYLSIPNISRHGFTTLVTESWSHVGSVANIPDTLQYTLGYNESSVRPEVKEW